MQTRPWSKRKPKTKPPEESHLKSLLEDGRTRAHGEDVRRGELA